MNITGETKLVGILGYPVAHSLSPRMQNAAFEAMGLDLCYVPLLVEPEELTAAVAGLKAMHFLGANVTVPHKVAVAALVDELALSASRTGVVNTIVNQDGRLVGHNTDGAGFIRALEETAVLDYSRSPVAIIGAGGAARSVAMALAEKGVPQISVINRGRERALEFERLLNDKFPSLPTVAAGLSDYGDLVFQAKIVINATPLGMDGHLKSAPVAADKIKQDHVVCDIVYAKSQETPFIAAARRQGATTMGGLGMLLHQGAAAIQLWTGLEPPIEIMRQALEL